MEQERSPSSRIRAEGDFSSGAIGLARGIFRRRGHEVEDFMIDVVKS